MTLTPLYVQFECTVTIPDLGSHTYRLRCTASPVDGSSPAVLWVEDTAWDGKGPPPYLAMPLPVWDEIDRQLARGGPARDAYDAQFAALSRPVISEAAE